MAGFTKFDPQAFLKRQKSQAGLAAKPPKVAKHPPALDALGELGVFRSSGNSPNTWGEAQEERAAIVEYEGGAPRDWAEAYTCLIEASPPAGVAANRWRLFLDDCGRFLDGAWAERASALGWQPIDFFGCDRHRPLEEVACEGLLWFLEGAALIALSKYSAAATTLDGARRLYQRLPVRRGRSLTWVQIGETERGDNET